MRMHHGDMPQRLTCTGSNAGLPRQHGPYWAGQTPRVLSWEHVLRMVVMLTRACRARRRGPSGSTAARSRRCCLQASTRQLSDSWDRRRLLPMLHPRHAQATPSWRFHGSTAGAVRPRARACKKHSTGQERYKAVEPVDARWLRMSQQHQQQRRCP